MIEFWEKEHIYLYEGWKVLPSVTQILKFKFPNKYEGIPDYILNKASEFGTRVHNYIEEYEKNNSYKLNGVYENICIAQYLKLKEQHNFAVLEQEQILNYEDRLAGKFDMIIVKDKKICLADIKCTSELDKEYLSWQLGFYKMMSEKKVSRCYVIWLRKKELGEFIKIKPKTKKECLELLKKYEEENKWV